MEWVLNIERVYGTMVAVPVAKKRNRSIKICLEPPEGTGKYSNMLSTENILSARHYQGESPRRKFSLGADTNKADPWVKYFAEKMQEV